MANTLYDYYTGLGQALPSLSERSKIYESSGLGSASGYQGTSQQNTALLGSLQTPTSTEIPETMKVEEMTDKTVEVPEQLSPDVVSKNAEEMIKATSKETIKTAEKAQADAIAASQKESELEIETGSLADTLKTSMEQLAPKATDTAQALEDAGVNEQTLKLKGVTDQMAQLQANLNLATTDLEGKPLLSSFIGGSVAKARNKASAQLGALAVTAQVYQGNIEQAKATAQQVIDAKYGPIEQKIANTKELLALNFDLLSREDKTRADALTTKLNAEQKKIDEQKLLETNISNLIIQGSAKGLPQDIAKQMSEADSILEASLLAGPYLKDVTEPTKIGTDNDGNDLYSVNGNILTTEQLASTPNLGTPESEYKGLLTYNTRANNPGMNRSDRNNNPGNIKASDFTKNYAGVIGVESSDAEDGGKFLIFDSAQSGIDAIGQLLLNGRSYKGVTAEQAIKKYNGGGGYGASDVGLKPNDDFQAQIKDSGVLKDVTNRIAELEGFTGASVSNNVNEPVPFEDWIQTKQDAIGISYDTNNLNVMQSLQDQYSEEAPTKQVKIGNVVKNLSPTQKTAANALAKQIYGSTAIKTEFGYNQFVTPIMDRMKAGESIDDIADELRFQGQSTAFTGSIRDAGQSITSNYTDKKTQVIFDKLDDTIGTGEIGKTRDYLKKIAVESLGTAEAQQTRGKERTVEFLGEIQDDLNTLENAGINTNIFTGTLENVNKKVGKVNNLEMRKIATKIAVAIQSYRRSMSGVAFSVPESEEYEAMFPNINKTTNFNKANIEALTEVFEGDLDFTYSFLMGDDAYNDIFKNTSVSQERPTLDSFVNPLDEFIR